MPDSIGRAYDMLGLIGLAVLFLWGGRILNVLFTPTLAIFLWVIRTL
jgi:hypothetical protein